ncbi:unnamed protein product [Schistocephalus solidus]|uniref:Recep_L_domain domain-containing protein n=1 Tax=Schistocephalus solidus TaxID=70667 RepID=A0A183SUZ4_SCHSO|nr:unnamed protein product [Schistocephalus solidus]
MSSLSIGHLEQTETQTHNFLEQLENFCSQSDVMIMDDLNAQDTFQNFWVLTLLKLSSVLMAFTDSESCASLHAECNIAGSADLNQLISQTTANSHSPTYLLVQNTGSVTLNGEARAVCTYPAFDIANMSLIDNFLDSLDWQHLSSINDAASLCDFISFSNIIAYSYNLDTFLQLFNPDDGLRDLLMIVEGSDVFASSLVDYAVSKFASR